MVWTQIFKEAEGSKELIPFDNDFIVLVQNIRLKKIKKKTFS